jgi:hypothetical protein
MQMGLNRPANYATAASSLAIDNAVASPSNIVVSNRYDILRAENSHDKKTLTTK